MLLNKGAEVVGLVRDHVPQSNLYLSMLDKSIKIVYGSISDSQLIERTIHEHDVNTVFHLAAQAIVGAAKASPISTLQTNIMGTATILEAVRTSRKVERVVIASTDKVYGNQSLPYTEHSLLLGNFPYDASKIGAELLTRMYYNTYFKFKDPQVSLGITRCANLFGGGDLNRSRVIPKHICNVIKGRDIQYNSCKRQFLYVLDAVQAYILLAEKLDNLDVNGEAFNFGCGEDISMKDLAQNHILNLCKESRSKALQVCYPDSEEKIGCQKENKKEYPPTEIQEQWMSIQKANHVLGWKPVYSFDEGL